MKKNILWLLALIWSVTAVGETITVARALEICGGLASGASTTESYTIEGYVNKITDNSFSATYNNMTFWIADSPGSLSSNASGALYVYRGRPSVELQKGDRISITDYLKNYNGTIETATTNASVTLLERPGEREITYGSLRVCAQNLENYYIHPNTGRGNYTEAEITEKTQKIVSMMLTVDADIYAFCEVEAKPEVLSQLASAANASVNGNPYVAVADGIDEEWDATYNNNIKSGFIYRSDRVQPVGNNAAASTAKYYRNTMRYQTFSQLSSGEKMVVCMNHFKAKDNSADQGESTRVSNANSLINALSTVSSDPDILILGDLNCTYDEAPITVITNAGYAEQLLRFNDGFIYSHCYGGGELIDHALANSSMASQIVDAYIRHLSTTCSVGVTSEMSYSDHDPYVVEINLASGQGTSPITTCAAAAEAALSVSANNELYNNGEMFTIRGFVTSIVTAYNPSYGNISFWMADTQNGGNVLQAFRCVVDANSIPNVNDYVEVTGQLTKYNATPEFVAGSTCQIIYNSGSAINLGPKTIAEFLQLKNVKDTCVLTGIVENIVMDSEDTTQYNKFGNFYINDGTGSLYIYGLLTADGQTQQFRTMGIDEGDTLTLKAVYAEFNSNPQAKNAIYVSHSKFVSTNWGPVTVKLDPTSVETYNWGNVGIWAWVTNGTNSTDLFASWPGVQVTKDITGWWSYTFENIPEGQLNIIWNDFGSYGYQTADINNITDNTCFKLTGKSYYQVVTCQDTLHLANVANYIDFQALSAAYPAMTATTITSTHTYTLPNGSVLRGWLNPETSAEASNTWNVKENYNTVMPTPEMNGVEALRAGTMFRAASHTSISLGAFNMPTDGKLTVYFQPNGDSNRGVSITVGDKTYDFMKSGVKIDNIRPAYAAEVDLPAGYYMKGSVVITVLSNTINIFGVRISPEPEVVLSNDLTVAEAITLGNQLGNNTLSEDSVSVIGYVVSAQPFDMAFGNQSFYIADAPNGEQTMQAYRAIPMKDGALYPVLVGDLVRIKGKIQHYVNSNTSEDFVELYQPTVSFLTEVDGDRSLPAVPVISVTQALQYGNELSVGYRTRTFYDIVGYVTNIVEDAVSTYGNMTFWISDTQNGAASNAEGGFYVYRGATGKSLQVGDQVRVRTYMRNTSVLIDNSNVIASAASVPVTFLCQSMSNVNISKVWPIILDNTTYSAWNGKIQYDFRQNDENCFFYNWENTYSSISSGSGLNFYGNYDGYWRFVVGTQNWAGGGLYLGNNPALTAEALRQAIVAHPEKYYMHMAVKATDNYTHAFYVFDSEAAAFELGDHSAYGHEVRQNFTRNGEWQEIYVPLSDYVNAFAAMDMSNNPNLFVILSEGVQGAQIDLDAVFICEIGENTPQPTDAPTAADLVAAGYNMTNNIVLCFQFDVAPCNDVVVAGTYRMDSLGSWITDPSQLVHMTPLAGFEGWYAAQIPYSEYPVEAKPVQLANDSSFNWDYQAGDDWIHWGGNEAYIESGYNNEVNVYYESPGAYIYEIAYWKNNNNPCNDIKSNYSVYLNAPQNAPDTIEIIGSFDNWIGTLMTYDAQAGLWTATITATPTDAFKFRQAGTWNNEIQVYDAENDTWRTMNNCTIGDYIVSDAIVYADFSNPNSYRWTIGGSGSDTSAVTDPIELTISSITSEFYTEDNDIWYRLNLEDEENYFAIDIIVPQGMTDVELGHVYTWSDMLQKYCGGNYNGKDISYSDVQFVKTQTASGVQISALITATNGQQYILTYVGADVTPYDYDAVYTYSETFSSYQINAYTASQLSVLAYNDDNAEVQIVFNMPEGCDSLIVGTYPINDSGLPMTVQASAGFVSGVTPSWAGYYDSEGYINIPVWFMVSGSVYVSEDGTIYVSALNSKGASVQCQLTQEQVPPQPQPQYMVDWDNLPDGYVVEAACPADANLNALQSVKVFADANYIYILAEPDMDELPDLSWVPFHIYLNTDNSDATGGCGSPFADANTDILMEGAVFADGQPRAYEPAVFKWWGAVGEEGWDHWTDPAVEHDADDCWGAIVCEGALPGVSSQYIDGKIEIRFTRSAIPATWNASKFGIGIDIQQNWSSVGVLPIASPTDLNPSGMAPKMTVPIYGAPYTPSEVPTVADLRQAGYDVDNNVVLAYMFDVAPCNDVVVAGTYRLDSLGNWITDPSQLVHMTPLAGFEGWYAAQIPYSEYSVQAKPVQLSDVGAFNWDYQAGDYWIHWGGNEAYIESGYNNEVNVYYESPGAYIYEIPYWKNNNNPCTSHTSTYTVLLSAPQNAPDAIEIIGSFDNWIGTPMTYDAQTGFWTATITATPTDVFKFRQAGTWDNEILVYDAENNAWMALPNMVISQYLYDNIVYVDFDNPEMYRWLKQGAESEKYIPYNLHAVSEPGKVVFTWEAEMISDSYALNIYDVADNNRYLGHLSVQGVTSLTYMVEDFLDGKEIRWSLEPQSPYMLDEVFADSTIIMHKSQVELSNFNLSTADGITLDLTWQSSVPVLQYMVEVEMSGSLLRQEIVTTAEFHYTSPIPGVANVYVAPLNAAGEAIGRYAYAGAIELPSVPEPFKNLQAVANEHDINATWEGAADSVYLQIFHMVDGEFTDIVYQSVVAGHSFTYTVEEDGNYAVQLRAWEEMNPGEYGIMPYANYVVVQVFTVPTYTIQINATEGGYIFPSGLSGNYPVGYTLNAYAYPYEGYRFVRWSDGVAEAERTINVQGAMSVTAQFETLAVYNVAVQAAEGGWIYVQGEMDVFNTSYMSEKYEDTQLTIYASAAQGYSFYQWSDGETNAQRTVTVNSNITLTAIFMPNRHLTLAVNDIAMGGISVAGEYSYADGVYTTAHNASLTLTAQPNQGYRFVNWSDGVQTVQRVVTMTEDKTLTAFFELITTPVVQYTITVSAGVGGTVNNASGTYNAGDQIELKATPMEGYEFVQWSDGVSTNPRTLTVTGNKSLIAIFRIRTISISVTAEAGGTVNGTVSGAYDYGTSVSFSAVPAEHYRFTGWSDGNTDRVRYITLVKDTVITASFVAIPLYTLSLTAGEGGQIRVDNEPYTTTFNRVYEENTSVVIEAAANANYVFSRWSDGNTNAIRVVPMNSDLTLTAEFLPLCTLTIIANNGSVLLEGNAEATANNVYKAAYGTVLTLTAQPAEGYRFVNWSDGVQTISREITLTSTLFLVANFELASTTPQYTVTIGIAGTGTGKVNGVTSISARYYENDQLPLTAEAGESSEFAGWSDGVTTASRTLVVSSDTVIIAIFNLVQTPKQYTVTFKNYDGTVLESKLWNEGETPVCSVTPTRADDDANTYSFVGWTPEIVPVAADAVYTAVFEATPITPTTYTVTFYDWDDTILSTQTVNKGENATPPATPTREGYVFTGWDGNYTNVQQDESVFATYKPAEEALDNVLDGNMAVKIFREGQILIIRGDKTYTLTGQELK